VAKFSLVNQGYQLVRHIVPAIVRPAHTLWHEVIGVLFLTLAVWPIPSGIRALRDLDAGKGSLVRLILTGAFVAIMAGYGISSFRRARKISRS
jgi:type VI protein secretion system component VasK